jgi:signal transduction histidine kinase
MDLVGSLTTRAHHMGLRRPWAIPRDQSAPFGKLRLQLTLWYTAVLAGALLISGIALYLGVRELQLRPIKDDVAAQASLVAREWQRRPDLLCPLPGQDRPFPQFGTPERGQFVARSPIPIYFACFDASGHLLRVSDAGSATTRTPDSFATMTLVPTAIQKGSASGIVDAGDGIGQVYRYAVRVPTADGEGTLGVVQVGRSIAEQRDTLRLLRTLLTGTGAVALVVAAVGGLLLANRALQPARLAFARQQEFVADAAHELRTPLTLLRADAEVLLRGRDRLSPEDADLLDDIVAEVEHVSDLTSDLLLLVRLDAGQLPLEREVVDLAEVAEAVAGRFEPLAAEKGVRVSVAPAEPALVMADRRRVEQVAMILLDNAIKYANRDDAIAVSATHQDGTAQLAVTDTGPGIPEEHLARLGQRFYRVDKARSRELGGAGLGLAIARSIATVHGGALEIASQPGKGTSVTLSLPAV